MFILRHKRHAMHLDLNNHIELGKRYEIVTNLGTAEHVFNILEVFRTIHRHTKKNGLMIHGLPFFGWFDHGFYNFNPTFFWDIAATNGYQIISFVYAELAPLKLVGIQNREHMIQIAKSGEIGKNSLLYVIFKKINDNSEFLIPIQGYYAKSISSAAQQTWKELR